MHEAVTGMKRGVGVGQGRPDTAGWFAGPKVGHVLNGVFRAVHSSFYRHYYLYRTNFKGCIKGCEQNEQNLNICRPKFIIKLLN